MSTWNRNAESLMRGQAIVSGDTHVGDWHLVKGCSTLSFFTRMTSAGSPHVLVDIDYAIFEPHTDVISPDDAYNTVQLIAAFATVWNGTDRVGNFTYTACPAELAHAPVCIRVRATGSIADVTAFDCIVVKETRT